ncbi:MAG: hypothetical protein AAGK02_09140, partial [Pseudomonadota bacterium]
TDRKLLPIRFNVNIRASFYELLTSMRSIYDPAFIRDPRSLGLLAEEQGQFIRPLDEALEPASEPVPEQVETPEQPAVRREDEPEDASPIQSEESETMS